MSEGEKLWKEKGWSTVYLKNEVQVHHPELGVMTICEKYFDNSKNGLHKGYSEDLKQAYKQYYGI